MQVNRVLRTGMAIERHASEVYTRALFEKFSKELYLSGSFGVGDVEENNFFHVSYVRYGMNTQLGGRSYIVGVSPDGIEYFCQCKMFEHSGIPCRHIIKVPLNIQLILNCFTLYGSPET